MTKPLTKASQLKIDRISFAKQAGLRSLKEIDALNEADLVELTTQFPKAAAQLIIDLRTEWALSEVKVAEVTKERNDLLGPTGGA